MRGKKLSKTVRDFDGVVGWCWLDIRCQFYHSAEQGGEKIKKKPNPALMGKDKDSFKSKMSCMEGKEHSLPPISRWCPVTSWEAGLQLWSSCYRRQMSLQQICTPLLLFPQHLYLSRHHVLWDISGQIGPAALAVSSPGIFPTLRLLMRGNIGESFLVQCEPCSAAP